MDPVDDAAAPAPARTKEQWRRLLRQGRRAAYSGLDGAQRREREAQDLLSHAATVLEGILPAPGRDHPREHPTPGHPAGRLVVAAFHPTPEEPDLMPLLHQLCDAGAQLLFPAAAAGRELSWIRWDGRSAFGRSPGRGFGMEPPGPREGPEALAGVDLMLTPALGVDRSGTRLGHGGGYYDRTLARLRPAARVITVIHPQELLPARSLPREPHDHSVGEVLTARGASRVGTDPPVRGAAGGERS